MRLHSKPWLALLLLAVLVTLTAYLVSRAQRRFAATDAQMAALLPRRDAVTGYLDVATLRRAGLLALLKDSGRSPDSDYQRFVEETGFDYARDLQSMVGTGDAGQLFVVVRARFDWKRLYAYALGHGGACRSGYCQLPTSRPGKWASFLQIDPDVGGLALGGDPANVLLLSPRRIEDAPSLPAAPVWATFPHSMLADPKALPVPLRMLVFAVQGAERVLVSAGPDAGGGQALKLRLEANFSNAAAASTAGTQLQIDTNLLKMELQREHREPSRSDLTGLLSAGSFQDSGNTVFGSWPVYPELLQHLR